MHAMRRRVSRFAWCIGPHLTPYSLPSILPPSAPRHSSSCRSAAASPLPPFLSIHYPTLSSSSTAVKAARSRGNPPYTHVHISRTRDERPVEGWRKKEDDCVRMHPRGRRGSKRGRYQFSALEKNMIYETVNFKRCNTRHDKHLN